MKVRDLGCLFLLAALWGASFLFMRIASPILGPFLTINLRVFIAGAVLLLYSRITKHQFHFKRFWKQYLFIGAFNAAIPFTLIAAALSITATICYAFSGAFIKLTFKGVDALSLTIGQQLAAAIILLPITIFKVPSGKITALAIFSVLGLALFCTAIAYLIYFKLIENVGPTKTLSVTFLVPIFGIIWGVILLKEKITSGMLIGLVIILISIFVISEIKIDTRSLDKEKAI